MLFQALDIACLPVSQRGLTLFARQFDASGKALELQPITSAAQVQSKAQYDGDLHRGRNQEWSAGKGGGRTEEVEPGANLLTTDAINEKRHQITPFQRVANRQGDHTSFLRSIDDVGRDVRAKGFKHLRNHGILTTIHQHAQTDLGILQR